MPVVLKGGEKEKGSPVFHDFLGITCAESQQPPPQPSAAAAAAQREAEEPSTLVDGLVSGSSHLPSERQGMTSSEVFHFHNRQNSISGPESSNTFSGRKRSNSDSAYMGLIRDGMPPVGSDSHTKVFGKEVMGDRQGRSHDDGIIYAMQPPQRPTSSLILHPTASGRHDLLNSRWERSVPTNPGQKLQFPSRFAQSGNYLDKLSSCVSRDGSSGAVLISQVATDEGSRTGIKGSRIMNIINPASATVERNSTVAFPNDHRSKVPQTIDPETSNVPSRQNIISTTRQMTIFYGGQAHVFDDVHPNKAEVIMALAGSSGGSWSTTFSPNSTVHPPVCEAKLPGGDNDTLADSVTVPMQGNPVRGVSQVARIPIANNLPNYTSGLEGGHQAGRVDVTTTEVHTQVKTVV